MPVAYLPLKCSPQVNWNSTAATKSGHQQPPQSPLLILSFYKVSINSNCFLHCIYNFHLYYKPIMSQRLMMRKANQIQVTQADIHMQRQIN